MDQIENAMHLLRSVDRSTARIGYQMLECHGTIVGIFAKKLGWFHGKELMWVPSFGRDRWIRISCHVVARGLVHPTGDQGESGGQQLFRPERFDAVDRGLDGLHRGGAMNSIEDRLVIAHLFDNSFQCVFGNDRWRRVIRVPDVEILSGFEVDVVTMRNDQAGGPHRGYPKVRSTRP